MDNELIEVRRCVMTICLVLACSAAACGLVALPKAYGAPIDVITYKYDPSNSGVNRNEKVLTLANVNATTFGNVFSVKVDGEVFTQPLVKTGVHIRVGPQRGTHDVVYFATEYDSLFARIASLRNQTMGHRLPH